MLQQLICCRLLFTVGKLRRLGISSPRARAPPARRDRARGRSLAAHSLSFSGTSLSGSFVLFNDVMPAEPEVKRHLVAPWLCFYACATVVSVVSIVLSVGLFRQHHMAP